MIASSRHVRRYLQAPAPQDQPEAFLETVLAALSRYDVRLVMPMTDGALALCNRHRGALPTGVTLAAAPPAAVRNVLDKRANLETARLLGIPRPAEVTLESLDQLPTLIELLGFPMVLKNPGYRPDAPRPALGFKWLIANDERELDAHLERHSDGQLPLFQELVRGTIRNLCCFAASGTIEALHEYVGVRRLGWAGTGVLMEITDPSPRLADYAERLLRKLRWDGPAQVAFIIRDTDGEPRYMETNGRFWGSVAGSIRMGWDFPYWTYRYFTAGELPSPPPIRVGSRTCWHYGDLRLLSRRWRGLEPPTGPPPGKLRAVGDYLSGFGPGVRSDVFRLDDPLPELVEHWSGMTQALARRIRRQ
jgi:predicted ATP-grasp superfamily ATP-dependent carboligase